MSGEEPDKGKSLEGLQTGGWPPPKLGVEMTPAQSHPFAHRSSLPSAA